MHDKYRTTKIYCMQRRCVRDSVAMTTENVNINRICPKAASKSHSDSLQRYPETAQFPENKSKKRCKLSVSNREKTGVCVVQV